MIRSEKKESHEIENDVNAQTIDYILEELRILIRIKREGFIDIEYYDEKQKKTIILSNNNVFDLLNEFSQTSQMKMSVHEKSEFFLTVLKEKFNLFYLSDLRTSQKKNLVNQYLKELTINDKDYDVWKYVWEYINK